MSTKSGTISLLQIYILNKKNCIKIAEVAVEIMDQLWELICCSRLGPWNQVMVELGTTL